MSHEHYTPFTLSADLGDDDCAAGVLERLYRCPECRGALETLSRWLAALDHFDPRVGPEYVTCDEHFEQLFSEHDDHEARLAVITLDDLYHQWGLAHALITESRRKRPADPGAALQLAELALKTATRLDSTYYHPAWVSDLCAIAAVNFAEAQRLLQDPVTADDFLHLAVDWQLSGTLRPRIARRVATLEAKILRDRGRHEEALDRLLRETAILEATAPAPDANLLGWFFGHWRERADLDEFRRASNAPGER